MNAFQVPSLLNCPSENKVYLTKVVNKQNSKSVEDNKVDASQTIAVDHKIVILLHTKDIDQEDRALLQKFGRVRDMNYSMYNLDLNKLDCDYLLVDCRDKLNKMHITRVKVDDYNFVLTFIVSKSTTLYLKILKTILM